ncbi:MAG: 16S rRNA (guanine(527)-N(7))-methyltransferase RsmG [Chitinophagales bacterium]
MPGQIKKYFPHLSPDQQLQFSSLFELYVEWNEKINLISRKDISNLYERHVLHSLSIAKFILFKEGTRVLDVGTGGGFPGIPLAILFPKVKFHLVDSVGKKINAAEKISFAINLVNVSVEKSRAEDVTSKYDFIVSRAVAPLKTIFAWTDNLIDDQSKNDLLNGWILFKGGEFGKEIQELHKHVLQIPISRYFDTEFFNEKYLIYFPK